MFLRRPINALVHIAPIWGDLQQQLHHFRPSSLGRLLKRSICAAFSSVRVEKTHNLRVISVGSTVHRLGRATFCPIHVENLNNI
jgi:hypothetical protein